MKFFNRTLAIDFGSSNTVVYEDGQLIFDEPTVIIVFQHGKIREGNRACGFFDSEYESIRPIVCGNVENKKAFEAYVKRILKRIVKFPRICLNGVVIAVPNDINEDEKAAFCEPFRKLGVKNIRLIPKSLAACLGSCGK